VAPTTRGRRDGGIGRTIVGTILVGLITLGVMSSAAAQMKVGVAEVKSVTGQVEVQRKGQTEWVPAAVGMKLAERDEIRAHAGASAVLDLPDGSTLFIAENSRLVVAKLEVDPQNNSRRALFHLVVGKVRAVVAEAAITLVRSRQSNFAISTPTAVAAVRGTLYEVSYNADRSLMMVAVLPGKPGGGGLVTCASFFGRSAPVNVSFGYVTYATGTEGCRPPVSFESLSLAEQANIGTLINPVAPGPTFNAPVGTLPTTASINTATSGPSGVPVTFITNPTGGQNPSGGPSSIGVDAGQPPPPATTQ
jgi:hypothetical protein